jgi:hypothetical protein
MSKKSVLFFGIFVLYVCIGTIAYAEDLSMPFEVAYQIETEYGMFLFSKEPTKVESITGLRVYLFGPFFDSSETYDLHHFPIDTVVAFWCDYCGSLKEVALFRFYHRRNMEIRIADSSYSLVLQEHFARLQGEVFLSGGHWHDEDIEDIWHPAFILIVIEVEEEPPHTIRFVVGEVYYTVNGHLYVNDVAPFIDTAYNRVMIPVRAVTEALGTGLSWIWERQSVVIFPLNPGRPVHSLTVGVPLPQGMGVPVLKDGRVFIPVRYVAEVIGAEVRWDSENQAIYVYR